MSRAAVLWVPRAKSKKLIPLALAGLLTFLLAPLVTRLERWIGRIAAVLLVVATIFSMTGMAGWVLTRQLIDLATKHPSLHLLSAGHWLQIDVPEQVAEIMLA